jgi:tRNA(Ile)-lysidine synthase TilS/MesJ
MSESYQVENAFTASLDLLPSEVKKKGFVAAVSGGCDSMVMLRLFHRHQTAGNCGSCQLHAKGI